MLSALWVYGKLPGKAPAWAGTAHRISGRLAFIITLPVAYHCLWSFGFQDTSTRVLIHSLLGCAFYGAFAAKVTIVRSKGLPGIALPIAGGLTFAQDPQSAQHPGMPRRIKIVSGIRRDEAERLFSPVAAR